MSSEISISLSIAVNNGYVRDSFNPGQKLVDQAGVGRYGGVQDIGYDASEALDFGDVETEGYLILQNLDTGHNVDYGPDSGGSMVAIGRLKPGEVALLRLKPGVTVRAQAVVAATGPTTTTTHAPGSGVRLLVQLYED
ncbi:MAG: hypothetical protein ACOY3P_07050 [Planctomycetota bacterium]